MAACMRSFLSWADNVAFAVDHDEDEPHAVGVGVLPELVQVAQHGILEELVDEFDAVDVELLAGDAGQVEILPAVGAEEAAVDRQAAREMSSMVGRAAARAAPAVFRTVRRVMACLLF